MSRVNTAKHFPLFPDATIDISTAGQFSLCVMWLKDE